MKLILADFLIYELGFATNERMIRSAHSWNADDIDEADSRRLLIYELDFITNARIIRSAHVWNADDTDETDSRRFFNL